LMYHRVLPRGHAERLRVEPGMYVSPETFALHMSVLSERFRVLPLHEIVTCMQNGTRLPDGACAITFDDGWRDNLEYALPALEANELSATLFVVTDRVGTVGAFWPDEVARRFSEFESAEQRKGAALRIGLRESDGSISGILEDLKQLSEVERVGVLEELSSISTGAVSDERELLDWNELEDLSKRGVDVESHGVSHAILTGTSREDVRAELEGARRSLRDRGHGKHALLAYPSGGFNAEVVGLAREAGYAGAVTTMRGIATLESERLTLPRVGLHEDISSTEMEFLRWVPGNTHALAGTPE